VAKSVDNGKARSGKDAASRKPAKGSKATGKRADAKPARGRAPQRSRSRAGKPAERRSLLKFLHDVRIELGKVTWPTRKELMQSTLVVLVAVAIAAVYTFALDTVFSRFVDLVLKVLT
jgi:preprotein translocase subunit SecE